MADATSISVGLPASHLTELPCELQCQIFEHLSDLWSAISLRLTCRQLNGVYLSHQEHLTRSLREQIVAPFRDYYAFLSNLHLPAGGVLYPPPTGWPDISPDWCAESGKTRLVIDVLKHLPYIDGDRFDMATMVDYKSDVVNYAHGGTKALADEEWQFDELFELDTDKMHLVIVSLGHESGGVTLILDTLHAVVCEEIVRMDPGDTGTIGEYFAGRMEALRSCRQVFVPGSDPVDYLRSSSGDVPEYVADEVEAEGEPTNDDEGDPWPWLRHLYRKHGWPEQNWRKDECLVAIGNFMDRYYE